MSVIQDSTLGKDLDLALALSFTTYGVTSLTNSIANRAPVCLSLWPL